MSKGKIGDLTTLNSDLIIKGEFIFTMPIRIQFLGAAKTVTGSKFLLTQGDRNFLIDCGLFQGAKEWRLKNWEPLAVDPKTITAVFLTHAHLDHSGYLPLLVKEGFEGKIYATAASRALCGILLPDAAYLQEEDAAFANKHRLSKHKPALPLYTMEEAKRALKFFEEIPWHEPVVPTQETRFQFLKAGHILGAAMIQVSLNGCRVTFSGDLGRQKILTLRPPESPGPTDFLVLESTYGNRLHPQEPPQESLKKILLETFQRKGVVLIPAFAVGRVQQILLLLARLKKGGGIPDVPIFVNSPMATQATRIFLNHAGEHALTPEESGEMSRVARFVSSAEESKRLNFQKGPSVVISASGMATGGRVLHHLKFMAPNPDNAIVFVGFQAPETRGEAMIHGAGSVKIHGEMIPVRARVYQIDTLSAHADAGEILTWLKAFPKPPRKTFLVHGEPEAGEALQKKIEDELGWSCEIPDYLSRFPLS